MKYDIASIKGMYRGMARSLLATDMITVKGKKHFDFLLDMYYKYISYIEKVENQQIFEELIKFYVSLLKHDVNCEMIAYDTKPLKTVYGYSIEFLGIDIIHDECESLLEIKENHVGDQFLNRNGLCNNKRDAINLTSLLDHGDVNWIPFYIYRIVI